ncbi:MAG: lytic transglycosylase domain-containing protein [Alphaproteobacteria bacterium]|nr:lytic transglycosylase domain-containing protein [Alphaproteobacteria bacterium]
MRGLALAILTIWSGTASAAEFRILSPADADRYERLFRLEAENRWEEADALAREVEDPLLMGHVLYWRYAVSRDYVTPYEELRAWLDAYGDHPGAHEVSRLALKRRPPGALPPPPEKHPPVRNPTPVFVATPLRKPPTAVGAIYAKLIAQHLRDERPDLAHNLFRDAAVHRALGQDYADKLGADIAFVFYLFGKDAEAYSLASRRADLGQDRVSLLHWVAGLAALRLGWHDAAARHFAAHARSPAASPWNASAGAFWTARMLRQIGRPDEARAWLREAARHKRTFYGMLAREQLGLPHGLNFEPPPLDEADRLRIHAEPAAVRALALAEVGLTVEAEAEMRRALADADADTTRALLAASTAAHLPRAALLAGRRLLGSGDEPRDLALYPLAPWEPEGGYGLDRALLLGFMRRESAFDTRAYSSAGARGLMQLMPSTANAVAAGERFTGKTLKRLFEPELNLTLGRDYLRMLLDKKAVSGDLLNLVIAYNAGAGRLRRWNETVRHMGDRLLFIESLPAKETRLFVERVLTNIWAYRARLGQQRPSLAALAAGGAPLYKPLDSRRTDACATPFAPEAAPPCQGPLTKAAPSSPCASPCLPSPTRAAWPTTAQATPL